MEDHIARTLFHERTILARIDELAQEITAQYRDRELTVIAVLNGALMFTSDLLRRIPLPLKLDCISVASYHGGTQSSGTIIFNQLSLPEVNGRDVLIVDDILDTGLTLHAICAELRAKANPRDIKICVLLRKLKTREKSIDADFIGFDIEDEFVVGYGLDYQERYRNLPYVGVLRPDLIEPG